MGEFIINPKHNVFKNYRQVIYVNPYLMIPPVIASPFVSTWKTDNLSTGSSANNQVKLPLVSTGTYNFTVDWGDGNQNIITSWNQAEVAHTYAVIGTYQITITGTLIGFRFNSTLDRLKFMSVQSWGVLEFTNVGQSFFGCANLTLDTVSDVLNLGTNTIVLQAMFRGCSLLKTVNRINEWDTINCTDLYLMFYECFVFNQPLSFNTINVTRAEAMFYKCQQFNSLLTLNTSNVTNMIQMFQRASKYNLPLNFDTSKVTSISLSLSEATAFNQDLGQLNISDCLEFGGFFGFKTSTNYSAANYDSTLIGWASRPVQPNITISFNTVKRTAASDAAKAILTGAPNNWTITDGGYA